MPVKDEQPFLDAILARYHDDGLRIIYADFLDDAGEPERAEFVRLQVALARMTEDNPRRAELANREQDLRRLHAAEWSRHLSDLVADCDFRRGVLDSVVLDAAHFLVVGEELFERVPLRRVRLRKCGAVLDRLIQSPLLARIRELDLCDNDLGNSGVKQLTASPHFKALDSLDLALNGIDDAGVKALARASSLPGMTSLSLSVNNSITSAGVMELAESPFLSRLIALDLSGNDVDEAGVRAVVSSKTLVSLQSLRISDNPIGDGGVAALAQSELLSRLFARTTRLELRGNLIGSDGVRALAASPSASRCIALDLTHNSIGDAGLAAVVDSPQFANLRVLKAGKNQITDAGVVALRASWPRVFSAYRALDLSENLMTNYGSRMLQDFNKLGAVMLDLSRNVLPSMGAEGALADSEAAAGQADVDEMAELRRRVSHPNLRAGNRPGEGN
jgi:uncharacterized protein (TIGR02996 family)